MDRLIRVVNLVVRGCIAYTADCFHLYEQLIRIWRSFVIRSVKETISW
jgi:hypothetical protein